MAPKFPVAAEAHAPSETLASDLASAIRYARSEKSAATRTAYRTDFRIFEGWCAERGAGALPATSEVVAAYLAWEAERGARPSTIGRRCAAIRYAHKITGLPTPTDSEPVKATVRGIRRVVGAAPTRKVPAMSDTVVAMASLCGSDVKGHRDRALLLLGFAGAFRRSELVRLDLEDVQETREGLLVSMRRSKTDQDGIGRDIAIVRGSVACPVAALRRWIDSAQIVEGPIFRPVAKGGTLRNSRLSDKQVARTIKFYAERMGMDPSLFAGHSLRAGFLTSAARKRASIFKMRDVSGHRSLDVLNTYVRSAELFDDHAGAGLL